MNSKKILSLLLLLLLLSIQVLCAESSRNERELNSNQLRWSNVDSIITYVQKSGSSVNAVARIVGSNSNTSISGTLYLQKKIGPFWISVMSWDFSGMRFIDVSKYYSGNAGNYRNKVYVNAGGETITVYSSDEYIY